METNVKIIAWLHIVLSAIGLVGALCISALVFGGGLLSQDDTAITVTGIVALCLLGFFFLLSIPGLLAGIGLLRFRNWARILVIILSVLNLINVPVGTALGVYTLYVMLDDETSALFSAYR